MKLGKIAVSFCALALLLSVGCNGDTESDAPNVGAVTGTIKMDGAPLANVSVTFNSEGNQVSFGSTDAEGKYELTYKGAVKGAGIGPNTITIETVLEAPSPPGYKDPVPAKYNSATTLTAVVKEGDNVFDFDLESK